MVQNDVAIVTASIVWLVVVVLVLVLSLGAAAAHVSSEAAAEETYAAAPMMPAPIPNHPLPSLVRCRR